MALSRDERQELWAAAIIAGLMMLGMWVFDAVPQGAQVVTLTPAYQQKASYRGFCDARVHVFAPAHRDNRKLEFIVADELGPVTETLIDGDGIDPNRGTSLDRVYVLQQGQVYKLQATVFGQDGKPRGVAQGRITCQ